MADSFDLAYLYGRVCGSFSEAFLGVKGAALARVSAAGDLWKSVFGESAPDIPEARLISLAERRVIRRAISRFMHLAGAFSDGDRFVGALIRKVEYSDVKRIIASIRLGYASPEGLVLEGKEAAFDISAYPDPSAMFAGTRYSWIDGSSASDIAITENRLDRQYYTELWDSLDTIGPRRIGAIRDLIALDARLQNLVWALRLRRFYGFGREEVAPLLVDLPGADCVAAALESFDIDIDDPSSLEKWPWFRLAGPGQGRGALEIARFETGAQGEIHRAVRRALHFHPFTYTPLYCFFKLAEAEAALIMGQFEGVRLGASFEERISHAWALAGETA